MVKAAATGTAYRAANPPVIHNLRSKLDLGPRPPGSANLWLIGDNRLCQGRSVRYPLCQAGSSVRLVRHIQICFN